MLAEYIQTASQIALAHRRASLTAVAAEQMLLDLGFYNIEFTSQGLTGAWFLGIRYPL